MANYNWAALGSGLFGGGMLVGGLGANTGLHFQLSPVQFSAGIDISCMVFIIVMITNSSFSG